MGCFKVYVYVSVDSVIEGFIIIDFNDFFNGISLMKWNNDDNCVYNIYIFNVDYMLNILLNDVVF